MPGEFSSKQNLLFDWDGTLIDSEDAHARAYVAALKAHHPAMVDSFNYPAIAGQPSPQVFRSCGLTEDKLELAVRAKQTYYRSMIETGEIVLFPDVEEALDCLQRWGYRLFLVTGASRISVHTLLQRLKLQSLFSGVIAGEDTQRGKPLPDPYLLALQKFDLDPKESLAIEDSENGVRSAGAAGLDCVLVRSTVVFPGLHSLSHFGQLFDLLSR